MQTFSQHIYKHIVLLYVFIFASSIYSDVPIWLKTLRLHKYQHLFADMSYEELLSTTEDYLESKVRYTICMSIVCMYVCIYIVCMYMCICMYVCMYVCMYSVCMYVCMHAFKTLWTGKQTHQRKITINIPQTPFIIKFAVDCKCSFFYCRSIK